MDSLDTFSALQSLLLFQSIAAYGLDFAKVSNSLKSSKYFRNGETSADIRLDPDYLKELYHRLVKDAAKKRVDNQEPQLSPYKRKLPPPKSPNLEDDASTSKDLVADLIPSLYAHYQQCIIKEIQDEELEYESLLKQAGNLNVSRQDGQSVNGIQQDADKIPAHDTRPNGTPGQTPNGKTTPPSQLDEPAKPQLHPPEDAQPIKDMPKQEEPISERKAPATKRRNNHSLDSILNNDPQQPPTLHPSTTSISKSPPTYSPPKDLMGQGTSADRASPRDPNRLASSHPRNRHSESVSMSQQQPPYHKPDTRPSHSPPFPNISRQQPGSPVILPPPPGMQPPQPPQPPRHSFPPNSPYEAAAAPRYPSHMTESSHHAPVQHSVYYDHAALERDRPQSAGYPPRQYGDGWNHSAPHHTLPPPPQMNAQYRPSQHQQPQPYQPSSNRGGVILPPFAVQPQAPSQSHHAQLPRPYPAPPQSQQPAQPLPQPPSRQIPEPPRLRVSDYQPENTAARTPTSVTPKRAHSGVLAGMRRRGSAVSSPGSSTWWKVRDGMPRAEMDSPREISPISDPGESTPAPRRRQKAPQPLNRTAGTGDAMQPPTSVPAKRKRKPGPLSSDNEASPFDEHLEQSMGTAVAATKQEPRTPGLESRGGKSGASAKGKSRTVETPASSLPAPPGVPANMVECQRNFPKMAQPLLNIISSHRHASVFAFPVRDSDAEGYSSIVRRPQDLKSIKAAITAGSKEVAARVADQASPGAANTANSGTVVLPYSEALVPPKGIVNPAQLEQEIYRMLANAAMFNPGDEGVVKDTREMTETVEQAISSWRPAERGESGLEDFSSQADEEPGTSSVPAKRRRL